MKRKVAPRNKQTTKNNVSPFTMSASTATELPIRERKNQRHDQRQDADDESMASALARLEIAAIAAASANEEVKDTDIPDRVFCNTRIRIGKSSIIGAGRGMFVVEEVKAGSLIYSIDEPMMSGMSWEDIELACDNCFAVQANEKDDIISNVLRPVKISMCKGCYSAGYCSKKCQAEAWEHHHKVECKIMAKVAASGKLRPNHSFRMFIRIIRLMDRGLIPGAQLAEIRRLEGKPTAFLYPPTGNLETENRADLLKNMINQCTALTKASMHLMEAADLCCKLILNSLGLGTMALFPPKSCFGTKPQLCDLLGACFDPFAALMNHECAPKAFWNFEGKRLRVVASKDIKAGEEITISYRSGVTFVERQFALMNNYLFTCTCELCCAGADGIKEMGFRLTPPMKALRVQAYDLIGTKRFRPDHLEHIKALILAMIDAGIPEQIMPIPKLHQLIVCLCIAMGTEALLAGPVDTTTLLRHFLKVRNLTSDDPLRPELIHKEADFGHVIELVLASYGLMPSNFPNTLKLQDLDPEILQALKDVFWNDRVELISKVEMIMGKDSSLAQYERERLEKDLLACAGGKYMNPSEHMDPERLKRARLILDKFTEQPTTV